MGRRGAVAAGTQGEWASQAAVALQTPRLPSSGPLKLSPLSSGQPLKMEQTFDCEFGLFCFLRTMNRYKVSLSSQGLLLTIDLLLTPSLNMKI